MSHTTVHFTAEDVARVRMLPGLGPAAEALFSLRALRGRQDQSHLGGWREGVRAGMRPWFRLLGAISPPGGACLDLVGLVGPDLADDALLRAPREAVRLELAHFAALRGDLPPLLRGLDDDLALRREVLSALRAYHDMAVRPDWARIEAHLHADRAGRGADLLDGGVEAMLGGLHPDIRWSGSTLGLGNCGGAVEIHLDGRGLDVAPSYFMRKPALLFDPAEPERAVLVYPARLDGIGPPDPTPGLARLLGRTRAVILTAIAAGITTTGALARHAGTSAAAVSQHTVVLREAGLITTRRHHGSAHHTPTPAAKPLLPHPERRAC